MHFWIWQTLMRCTCFSSHPNQLKHSRLKLHDVHLFILLLFSGKTETQAILGHFHYLPSSNMLSRKTFRSLTSKQTSMYRRHVGKLSHLASILDGGLCQVANCCVYLRSPTGRWQKQALVRLQCHREWQLSINIFFSFKM